METILTPRLLFDGEDRPVEGGRYGMVEMTPWRVRMLEHVAKGAGREIGLTAKSPAYSKKGMLELAADGSILAGRETLARLSAPSTRRWSPSRCFCAPSTPTTGRCAHAASTSATDSPRST